MTSDTSSAGAAASTDRRADDSDASTSARLTTRQDERRFHQLATAAGFGLALMMAWALAAPWVVTVVMLTQVAGSISADWSLTRRFHRAFAAPLTPDAAHEDAAPFLRADALTGTAAFAGAVFVVAGIPPLGWSLVGLSTLSLLLDGLANRGPLRLLLERAFAWAERNRPSHAP